MTCLVCKQHSMGNYCTNCWEVLTNGLVYKNLNKKCLNKEKRQKLK